MAPTGRNPEPLSQSPWSIDQLPERVCFSQAARPTWSDEKVSALTRGQYSPAKLLCVSCFSLLNDMNKIISKYKRHSLPLNAKFRLEISKNMSKVNVEELENKCDLIPLVFLWVPNKGARSLLFRNPACDTPPLSEPLSQCPQPTGTHKKKSSFFCFRKKNLII